MLKDNKLLRYFVGSLIGLLIIILIIDNFVSGSFNDYLRGIFTETVGIIITIILIEILLTKSRQNQNKKDAKESLRRTVSIFNIYLNQFEEAAFYMSTLTKDLQIKNNKKLEKNFKFNNLSELFKIYPEFNWVDISMTKADVFFERLDKLKNILKDGIQQIDVKYFKVFSDLLLDYLHFLEIYYPKAAILGAKKTMIGDTKETDFDEQMIANHTGTVEYKRSNAINKYVRLYEIINTYIDFSNEYNKLLNKYFVNN